MARRIRSILSAFGASAEDLRWRWPARPPAAPFNWRSIRDWRL